MAATSRMEWKVSWFLCFVTGALFIFGLIGFALSGVEVRQRAEKRACEDGDIDACVKVGRYDEERSPGLFGFLLSHSDTSIRYDTRACAGHSGPSCERMVDMLRNGEQARDLSTPLTEIADAPLKRSDYEPEPTAPSSAAAVSREAATQSMSGFWFTIIGLPS